MGVTGGGGLAIGSLSRQTGSKVETIRYYERIGLLPTPARTASGYRRYDRAHLTRLAFIRRARALGFSLDEVRTLLRLADERERPCAEVRVVASAHLEDVRAKIADLQAMERVLRETVARCTRGSGSHCPLIEALSREPVGSTASEAGSGRRRGKMMRRYAVVTDQTLRPAAEAVSGHEPLPTRKRGGNRAWQPPRKSPAVAVRVAALSRLRHGSEV